MSRHREMQVLVTVVQTGSLASAARQLNLSQATITRAMASLEARLGTTLLIRSPRGINLSPAGEHFAASCRFILRELEQAELSVTGLHTQPAGQLNISLPLLMAHQVFMPIALQYLEAFPEMQMRTHTRENIPRLLEEGIDVALVVGHLPDSSGFAMPIGTVRQLICGSPDYFATRGKPETPDDLTQHRTILTTSMDHRSEWRLQRGSSSRTIRTRPVLSCTTRQAAITAAVTGLGLMRCMSYEAHHELQSGLLEPVLENFAAPDLPLQLIYREGRKAAGRVRTFIDFVAPRLRAHSAFSG